MVSDGASEFIGKVWPRSGFVGLSWGSDAVKLYANPWEYTDDPRGSRTTFVITGVTRDVWGSPLGLCTVKLFNTALDELQDTQTSGSDGVFRVTTVKPDEHYIMAYKADSIDVCGVTVNTITGL